MTPVRKVTGPFSYHGAATDPVLYVYPRRDGIWVVSDGSTIWHTNRSKPTALAYAKVISEHYGHAIEALTKPLYPWTET